MSRTPSRTLLVALLLTASVAAAEPPATSDAVMAAFRAVIAAPAGKQRDAALSRLGALYDKAVVHRDNVFELRGKAEVLGFADYVANASQLRADALPKRGARHETRYRYKLGPIKIDHVIGTEHTVVGGKVTLQREHIDLAHFLKNVPLGGLLARSRVVRALLRVGANYAVQSSLQKSGAVPKSGFVRRLRTAVGRARSVRRHVDRAR